jgi:hypothetical protein
MPKACRTYHREQIIALNSMKAIVTGGEGGGSSFHRPYSVTICVNTHAPCTTVCMKSWSRTWDSWGLFDLNGILTRSNWIYLFIPTFLYLKGATLQEKKRVNFVVNLKWFCFVKVEVEKNIAVIFRKIRVISTAMDPPVYSARCP